ncbi:hypothetical protein G7085_16310 [Tessaracoccus sp. HDW20]|uniref:hypothetical protein n=1 Tax=Tessaracoccus coleopterorum TaxID=2714950 RepID=UPI0018D2C346|nr:hypothetical protein [Tessaracoccus coleopterorum]NHB85626.1 hypothetical protein [Tessaracoccus coleopterorum]
MSPTGAAGDVVGHLVAANDEWLVVLPDDRAPSGCRGPRRPPSGPSLCAPCCPPPTRRPWSASST